ncbi:MAG: InlB B-repeat-containing protein [Treponema sp.]|nr:InlB B-repeat-containing protein [Treponema sp.]
MKKLFLLFVILFLYSLTLIFLSCTNPFIYELLGINEVTFNVNGGSPVPKQQVWRDEKVSRPADPHKSDFTFDNWFTDNEVFETPWDFDTIITGNITLYANWKSFGITLSPGNINFGSVASGYSPISAQSITITNVSDIPTEDLVISLSGSNPGSFSLSANNIPSIDPGDTNTFTIVPNHGLPSGSYTAIVTVSNNINITASINVSFVVTKAPVNGITIINQPDKMTYVHGEPLDLAGLVARIDYSDGTNEPVPLTDFALNSITANPVNGTILSAVTHNNTPVTVSLGSFNATTNPLTVNKAAGAAVSGAPTVSGNPNNLLITVSSVIFATGQTAEYSFSTTNNPGTWQPTTTFTAVVNTLYYVFVRSAENTNYEAGIPNTPGRQIAFYTVTFDTNGGDTNADPPAVTAVMGSMITQPTNPTRSGYTFGGWYDTPNNTGGNQWNFTTGTVTSATTLYARWLSNSSTITLDVAPITEGAPVIVDNITISRSGTGFPVQRTITITDTSPYSDIWWEVDGVGYYATLPPPANMVTGTGASFTLNADITNSVHVIYNTLSIHTLRLYVMKDTVTYMVNISFTIVE